MSTISPNLKLKQSSSLLHFFPEKYGCCLDSKSSHFSIVGSVKPKLRLNLANHRNYLQWGLQLVFYKKEKRKKKVKGLDWSGKKNSELTVIKQKKTWAN